MGHGFRAATTSTVALAALRRSRRDGADLATMAAEVHAAMTLIEPRTFVTALLVDIDLATGAGTYLSAHVPPLVVADGQVRQLPLTPALPLGLTVGSAVSEPVVREMALEPGQTLVAYSDGVVENRLLATGQPAGDVSLGQLLTMLLGAPSTPVHPARALIDGLLTLTGPELRDDATVLVARYR